MEELLYRFTFSVEEPVPVEKTAAEIECVDLFAQMEFSLKTLEMGSVVSPGSSQEKPNVISIQALGGLWGLSSRGME